MPTKEQISDKLNELLETTIDFSKLTKEDLESFVKIFADPSRLIQLGVKGLRNKAKKEILNRTLGDLLEKPVLEELRADDGPFGFGILPRLFPNRRKSKSKP